MTMRLRAQTLLAILENRKPFKGKFSMELFRMTPNDTMSPRPLDNYKPPKLGWCEDVVVLQRRTMVRTDHLL